MDDKFIYITIMIHKITPVVDYNYWLKHFDTQLNDHLIKIKLKVPKVAVPTNKKTLF